MQKWDFDQNQEGQKILKNALRVNLAIKPNNFSSKSMSQMEIHLQSITTIFSYQSTDKRLIDWFFFMEKKHYNGKLLAFNTFICNLLVLKLV